MCIFVGVRVLERRVRVTSRSLQLAEDKGYGGEVVVGGGRERRSCKLAWVGAWAIDQARELREEDGCSSTPTARIRRFGGVGEDGISSGQRQATEEILAQQ